MSTTPAEDLGRVLRAVGRRARMSAAIFALTLIAAVGVSRLGASSYEATAQILLQQPDQVNAVLNPDAITSAANVQREVNTNAQLITSVPVIDAVRRQLRLTESVPDLVDRLSVTGEATSNLVEITARDGAPDRAARIATAVAGQYQDYRRRSAQDAIGSAVSAAAIRLRGMDAATRGSAEGEALEARLHQLETGAAVATGGVQVVRPAAIPSAPEPRITRLSAAVALVLGLTLAGLAVVLLERTDRRLLDEQDVEDAFGQPVIGRIPAVGRRESGERRRVEAYDALAVRLKSGAASPRGRVIMLAAPAPRARDDVAIRLAEALADLTPRVMLIEADLRNEGGELAESGGLTAILCEQSTLEEEIVLASYRQDDDPLPARAWELLPAGRGTSRPTALLGSREMEALVARARELAGIVIVAAPSLAPGADALVLAHLCDEIVVVVHARSTTREQAAGARRVLASGSAPVAGIVVESGGQKRRRPLRHRRRRQILLERNADSHDEPRHRSAAGA